MSKEKAAGLTGYYCALAFLAWNVLAFAIFFSLKHYDLVPAVPPADFSGSGYVVQYLYDVSGRILKDPFCLPMALILIGCLAYALTLALATKRMKRWLASNERERGSWINRLVGLPSPLSSDALALFVARGASHATASLRDAITLFPAVGFLGTVVGVTIALGGLDVAMTTKNTGQLMSGLQTAFDTTFLGLLAALVLTIVLFGIDRGAEQIAALIDEPREEGQPSIEEPEEEAPPPGGKRGTRYKGALSDEGASRETPRKQRPGSLSAAVNKARQD